MKNEYNFLKMHYALHMFMNLELQARSTKNFMKKRITVPFSNSTQFFQSFQHRLKFIPPFSFLLDIFCTSQSCFFDNYSAHNCELRKKTEKKRSRFMIL